MKYDKKHFDNALKAFLQANPDIIAVWEGGSAATGYLDQYSDLDLAIICEDDAVESVFEAIEGYLTEHCGIANKFRLPEPTWHGHSQAFYILQDPPPPFYFDLVVMKRSAENQFLETDRHGEAVVWFDREGVIVPTRSDPEELATACKRAYIMSLATFDLTAIETEKQILRANWIDAMTNYHGLIQRRLATMLNLKYRPAQYDFGLRYAYRAYPKDVNDRLKRLMLISEFSELAEKFEEVKAWYRALAEELESYK